MVRLAQMPYPAPGILDAHNPTSGGSDLKARGSFVVCGDAGLLCLCVGHWKFGLAKLASHPEITIIITNKDDTVVKLNLHDE